MAASGLKAPGYLDLNGDLSQNFRDWHRSYQIYAIASGVSEKSQKIQCNVFLHVAGPAAQKVFSTWTIPDDEKDKIEPLITRFKTYCEGKRNNKKGSHTQLDSRKQVIAFQDRVITINIKEAQHPLK